MDGRDLRVSDSERQHVAELLQRAVGEGYITLPEFEERSSSAFAARTRGELNALITDIPGIHPAQPPEQASEQAPAQRSERLTLHSTASELKRKGEWTVPATLLVQSRLSTTHLDFSNAVLESRTIDIELDDKGGSMTVIVPKDATVDCNGIDASWSNIDSKVKTGPPKGDPHLVLHGKLRMSSLAVRYTRKGTWWEKMGLE